MNFCRTSLHRWTAFCIWAGTILVSPASSQPLPPFHINGPEYSVVTDVVVLKDGSQIIAGAFAGALSIGVCPGPDCQSANAASALDAFLARVDSQGNAQWLRVVAGNAAVSKLLLTDNKLYAVGSMTGLVDIGNSSIGDSDPARTGLFVIAIDDDGDSHTIDWISSASAEGLELTDLAIIGRDEPEYLVVGGNFDCNFSAELEPGSVPSSLDVPSDCATGSKPIIAALKLRGAFAPVGDPLNKDWRWATDTGALKPLSALAATPSGVVYAALSFPGVPGNQSLVRVTNTFTTPGISYLRVLQPLGVEIEDMQALDDAAMIVTGSYSGGDFSDFGLPAGPLPPGSFAARMNISSPFEFTWDWATTVSTDSGSPSTNEFVGVTLTETSAFMAGAFPESLDAINSLTNPRTLESDEVLRAPGDVASFVANFDTVTGELATTADGSPWIFGGNVGSYPLAVGSVPFSIHTNGLGRVALGGGLSGRVPSILVGTDELFTEGGGTDLDGFSTQITVAGSAVLDESWIVGQPIDNAFPVTTSAQPPQVFRNGIAIDAFNEGLLYFQLPTADEEGRIYPLSATDDPIEIVWSDPTDPLGDTISRSNTVQWPTSPCSSILAPTDPCIQRHVSGAPVELNSVNYSFRQLFQPAEGASTDATADPATGKFTASEEGYSVVRYADVAEANIFEVIRTELPVNFVNGLRRNVLMGKEIRPPSGFPQQPGRPGFVLNPDAYIDGFGSTAAYDRSRRAGQIIPVNRTNPASGAQALDVAWYQENAKGVYWPSRVDEYAPQWPDEARGLIISAVGFSPNNCSERPRLQLYNALTADDVNGGVVDLAGYGVAFPNSTIQLRNVSFPGGQTLLGPEESVEIPAVNLTVPRLCRNQSVLLLTEEGERVDQFGDPAVSEVWEGGAVSASDMIIVRAPDICFGNADRVNPFGVGSEWLPAESISSHVATCGEKIIIASQAGSEVSGRDFPTDLIISQYLEDGVTEVVGEPDDPSDPDEPVDDIVRENQLIELYNGSDINIDLAGNGGSGVYTLEIRGFDLGVPQPVLSIALDGTIGAGEAFVLANDATTLIDEDFIDDTDPELSFDGNDAVVLLKDGVVIDAFGGSANPGSQWLSQGVSSRGTNLVRSDRVCAGPDALPVTFSPHVQWQSVSPVGQAGFGTHDTDCIRLQEPLLDPNRYLNWTIYAQNDSAQIGFNPNDEHALRAASNTGSGFDAAFALRADFGSAVPVDNNNASEPYVLVRYRNPPELQTSATDKVGFRVFRVEAINEDSQYTEFAFEAEAGQRIFAPYPLSNASGCEETIVEVEGPDGMPILENRNSSAPPPAPFYRDTLNNLWARSANPRNTNGTVRKASVRYFYPLQGSFYYDDAQPGSQAGDCVPWMPDLPDPEGIVRNSPIPTQFDVRWPDRPLRLIVGETLMDAKRGLPQIRGAGSVKVVYDQEQEKMLEELGAFDPSRSLVEFFDPLQSRSVPFDDRDPLALPTGWDLKLEPETGLHVIQSNGRGYKLPFVLRQRLRVDKANNRLIFRGFYREAGNDPLLLLNVLSDCEAKHLKAFDSLEAGETFVCPSGNPTGPTNWVNAVDGLATVSRNPSGIEDICSDLERNDGVTQCAPNQTTGVTDEILIGYTDADEDGILERFSLPGVPGALSAGAANGSGYVTIALNDDPQLAGQPISLKVIHVGCLDIDSVPSPYQGRVHVIESDGIFDEVLSLRHSADFAGRIDRANFQWCTALDEDSLRPDPPARDLLDCSGASPWMPFTGSGSEITIGGANTMALSDNWVISRYQITDSSGDPVCQAPSAEYSIYAGAPDAPPRDPQAQLAEGWVKRVVNRLNPFDTRVTDFHSSPVNTVSSLIAQLGGRFEGDIPLVTTPEVLNGLGFIEAYETVLNRALEFIYSENPADAPDAANNAILLISTRLADLYTALGNEAYADAQDPLVGLTRPLLGTIATETFTFKNQLATLLEEELVLLRGRDDELGTTTMRPNYNRLPPNFTGAEGQAAYAIAYGVSDITGPDGEPDSIINEDDGFALYPQGHGDAWGHYLQAQSYHYDLLRDENFRWKARTENILLNGGPLPVDYLDERKFVANAAAKAKVGAQVVDLTYRDFYTENPDGQWQGYKDIRIDRQWGVSGWASRAGQGAYYDWLTANSIIPAEHEPLAFSSATIGDYCASPDPVDDPFCDCDGGACQAGEEAASVGFRDYFCALAENTENAYCDCVGDGDARVCPLEFPARGIQVIERGNVPELEELLDQYQAIQTQIDEANRGLNPLGIARDAVPFDIDPSLVDQNQTHFEQIAERATTALDNAARAWDFANRLNEMLRFNQDSAEDLEENKLEAEFDFNNRLLEIFGTPYPNNIGAGRTYPDGYSGPDLLHYFEVGLPALTGTEFGTVNVTIDENSGEVSASDISLAPGATLETISTYYSGIASGFANFDIDTELGDECEEIGTTADDPVTRAAECAAILEAAGASTTDVVAELTRLTTPELGLVFVNPGTGSRQVTGLLQQAYSDSINARIDLSKALAEYDAHVYDIIAFKDQFAETFRIREEQIGVQTEAGEEIQRLSNAIGVFQTAASVFRGAGEIAGGVATAVAECFPKVVGLALDVTSAARCGLEVAGTAIQGSLNALAEGADGTANALTLARDAIPASTELSVFGLEAQLELIGIAGDLGSAIEHEPVLRLEVTRRAQDVQAAQTQISNLLADGLTILTERKNYRRRTASAVSEYRFQDIAFRQFRNAAIQKYRATFDLAARFVYLAAKAYDYETNLLGSDSRAGQAFLTDVVRHRSIGQLLDGQPLPGSNGLSDSLGRMQANFQVLKGQMGFNNPQIETNRFSLRRELFRIPLDGDPAYKPSDEARWADQLAATRVMDINAIPEFRRLARPFAPQNGCPQPGLVIEFFSEVKSNDNFFGLELEAQDSSYDASQFATKIRGVGTWFRDYDSNILGLSETPRVYLLPVGDDVLRAANGLNFETRQWDVVDQVVPVPFPIGDNDIAMPEWSPGADSLSDAFALERRIGRFRAYPFRPLGFDQEFSTDSRLIGRSVWNSRWLLIIPGAALLGDSDEGLDRFIYGEDVEGTFWESDSVRDRYPECGGISTVKQTVPMEYSGGVSDILLFFKTYAYSGN